MVGVFGSPEGEPKMFARAVLPGPNVPTFEPSSVQCSDCPSRLALRCLRLFNE